MGYGKRAAKVPRNLDAPTTVLYYITAAQMPHHFTRKETMNQINPMLEDISSGEISEAAALITAITMLMVEMDINPDDGVEVLLSMFITGRTIQHLKSGLNLKSSRTRILDEVKNGISIVENDAKLLAKLHSIGLNPDL